jgi:hypothetical protein
MKKIMFISWLLLAFCLPAAAEAEEADLAPLLGTWVNPEYNPTRKPPKFVFKADGTGEEYPTTYATTPCLLFSYTIEEAWGDADGATWYKILAIKLQTQKNRFWHLLVRIGPDGTTYEEDHLGTNRSEYPDALDPESYFYKILYRQ